MVREQLILQNIMGLHTRASAKLVSIASRFNSQIQLIKNDQIADCKSIMSLILLGAKKGTTLELVIIGNDELLARDAIVDLFNRKFDEK